MALVWEASILYMVSAFERHEQKTREDCPKQ